MPKMSFPSEIGQSCEFSQRNGGLKRATFLQLARCIFGETYLTDKQGVLLVIRPVI